jgi:hypothetical protein
MLKFYALALFVAMLWSGSMVDVAFAKQPFERHGLPTGSTWFTSGPQRRRPVQPSKNNATTVAAFVVDDAELNPLLPVLPVLDIPTPTGHYLRPFHIDIGIVATAAMIIAANLLAELCWYSKVWMSFWRC